MNYTSELAISDSQEAPGLAHALHIGRPAYPPVGSAVLQTFGAAASGSLHLPQIVPPAACTPALLSKAGCSVSVFFLTDPFSTHLPAVISHRRYNHTSGNAAWYVPYPLYDKHPTTGRCSAKWERQTAPSP